MKNSDPRGTSHDQSPLKAQVATALLLRKAQVAALLNVSPRSVDNLVKRGAIPFVRLGRSVRFVPGSVLAAIKALEVSAN